MRKLILTSSALVGVLAIGIGLWALTSNSTPPRAHSLLIGTAAAAKIEIRRDTGNQLNQNDTYVVHIFCSSANDGQGEAVLGKPYTPRGSVSDDRRKSARLHDDQRVRGVHRRDDDPQPPRHRRGQWPQPGHPPRRHVRPAEHLPVGGSFAPIQSST